MVRQVSAAGRKLGPAWTERGRPPGGWFTKRTAEAWLREVLELARRGELPGQVRTGATFGDAAAEWPRFIEEDRERKPSTLVDYRSALNVHLLPAFGDRPLESIEPSDIEAWRKSLVGLSNRSKNKLLIQMHGMFHAVDKQARTNAIVSKGATARSPAGSGITAQRHRTSSLGLVERLPPQRPKDDLTAALPAPAW